MTRNSGRRRRRSHRNQRHQQEQQEQQVISFTLPVSLCDAFSGRNHGLRRICGWKGGELVVGNRIRWCVAEKMVVARLTMTALDGVGGSNEFFIRRDDKASLGRDEKQGKNGRRVSAMDREGRRGAFGRRSIWDQEEEQETKLEEELVQVTLPSVDSSLFVGSTVIGEEIEGVTGVDSTGNSKKNEKAEAAKSRKNVVRRRRRRIQVDEGEATRKAEVAGRKIPDTASTDVNGVRVDDSTGSKYAERSDTMESAPEGRALDKTRSNVREKRVRGDLNSQSSVVSGKANGVTERKINGARVGKSNVSGPLLLADTLDIDEGVSLSARRIHSVKVRENGLTTPVSNRGRALDEDPESLAPTNGKVSTVPELEARNQPSDVSGVGLSLSIGDLVVHAHHGIGRFTGLERTSAQGMIQEFAAIEYRDGDIYIPLCMLEILSRPTKEQTLSFRRLDSISSAKPYDSNNRMRRARVRHRIKVRSRIRTQIENLQELYTRRDSTHRPRYPVDAVAESRFHRYCTFQLTGDQQKAIKDIYRDLSGRDRPMDRLLCGDVGYGKTEIAVRAAFRVLQAGKQVAVLAPTTILALQHYETFKTRLEHYFPQFVVGCSTRFTGVANMRELRSGVAEGKIRVLIGTHTILSDKTIWENLGLVIIDEEHRFGVNQKEKIRARHMMADSLFMSATPIPRTLHLALSGMRDTSVLRNPPPGRKPIETRVSRSGDGIIRKAIRTELEREGQVFFVVPRVEGIENKAGYLQELFPSARIMIAHAKIRDLDKRIWKFSQGEYDILLTTTVIENGLDMPRVNTILVSDAQYFGLAQLHQLRGRVGRAEKQAFAYLLYKGEGTSITDTAVERLKALQRYSGLGAGFALAQRDMEMRGVGQVLGVEQSGSSTIKAEEYAQMLHEELESARTGQEVLYGLPKTDTTEIFLEVPSIIPDQYIKSFEDKMRAYTVLAGAHSLMELAKIVRNLESWYGELPEIGRCYIKVLELKIISKRLGIRKIYAERDHVILDWALGQSKLELLLKIFDDKRTRMRFDAVDVEERVILRGLGVVDGQGQLDTLRKWLKVLLRAADEWVGKPVPGGEQSKRPLLLQRDFELKVKAKSLA